MKNEELLSRAKLAFQVKDFKQAEKLLEKIINSNPNFPGIYVFLGLLYQTQKLYGKAIDNYKIAIEKNEKNVDAYNNLGVIYKILENYDQSLFYLKEALKLNSERADIFYNIGNVYKSLNNLTESVSYFEKALQLNPDYAPVYNNLGNIYEAMNKQNEAINIYQKGIKIDPNNPKLHYNLGIMYDYQNNIENALIEYQKALEINPNLIEAHNNIGVIYEKLDNLEEAEKYHKKALELDKNYIKSINNLALVYDKQKKYNEAIHEYKKALTINPKYYIAKNNLAKTYVHNETPIKAEKELEEVIKENETDINSYFNLAEVEIVLNKKDKAIDNYLKILQYEPNNIKARKDLANLYLSSGKSRKAIDQLNKILELEPEDINNILEIVKITKKEGNTLDAIKFIQDILTKYPEDINALTELAILYNETEDFKGAINTLDKLNELGINNDITNYNYAIAYKGIGNLKDAIKCMEKIITNDNNEVNDKKLLDLNNKNDNLELFNKLLQKYENIVIDYEKSKEEERKRIRESLYDINLNTIMEDLYASGEILKNIKKENIKLDDIETQLKDEDTIPIMNIGDKEPEYVIQEEEEDIDLDKIEKKDEENVEEREDDVEEAIKYSLLNLLKDQETYSDQIYNSTNEKKKKIISEPIQSTQDKISIHAEDEDIDSIQNKETSKPIKKPSFPSMPSNDQSYTPEKNDDIPTPKKPFFNFKNKNKKRIIPERRANQPIIIQSLPSNLSSKDLKSIKKLEDKFQQLGNNIENLKNDFEKSIENKNKEFHDKINNEFNEKIKNEFDAKMKKIDDKITKIAEDLAKAIVDKEKNEKNINLAESIIENKLDTKFKELDDILEKMREEYTVKETQKKENIIIEKDKEYKEEIDLVNLSVDDNKSKEDLISKLDKIAENYKTIIKENEKQKIKSFDLEKDKIIYLEKDEKVNDDNIVEKYNKELLTEEIDTKKEINENYKIELIPINNGEDYHTESIKTDEVEEKECISDLKDIDTTVTSVQNGIIENENIEIIEEEEKDLYENNNIFLEYFPPTDLNKLKDFEKITLNLKNKPILIKNKNQKENINITTKIIKGKKVDVFY